MKKSFFKELQKASKKISKSWKLCLNCKKLNKILLKSEKNEKKVQNSWKKHGGKCKKMEAWKKVEKKALKNGQKYKN